VKGCIIKVPVGISAQKVEVATSEEDWCLLEEDKWKVLIEEGVYFLRLSGLQPGKKYQFRVTVEVVKNDTSHSEYLTTDWITIKGKYLCVVLSSVDILATKKMSKEESFLTRYTLISLNPKFKFRCVVA